MAGGWGITVGGGAGPGRAREGGACEPRAAALPRGAARTARVAAAGSAAAAVPCAAAGGRGGRPPTLLVPGTAAARGDAWFGQREIDGKRGLYGRTLRSRAAW